MMDYENMPFVLKCWHTIATTLPAISIPFLPRGPNGKPLNVSVSVFSALFLWLVNVLVGQILVALDFPANTVQTMETRAALTAECHSNTLLVSLVYLFATFPSYQPSAKMSRAPQWWRQCCDAVLSFCIGYMVYDSSFFLVKTFTTKNGRFSRDDICLLAHHMMTATYMMQVRIYGAGHFSAMICMFWGEFTNPFLNGYYIFNNLLSLDTYQSSTVLHNLAHVNKFLLAITYVPIRAVIGPLFFLHTTYDLVMNGTTKNGIPARVLGMWVLFIWTIVYGSLKWVQFCWAWLQNDYFPVLLGGAANQLGD